MREGWAGDVPLKWYALGTGVVEVLPGYHLTMEGISYEYFAANPEVSHGYLYGPVSRLLAEFPEKTLVVDMGCGNGTFISLFRDRGWELYGSDFSPTAIEIAKQHFPGIGFSLADAQSLSGELTSKLGTFDVVISTEVIEHVYNPRGFLQTCNSLLKPGGTLVLTTPYHGYLKNLMLAVTGKLDGHFTVLWDHGHIKFWSVKTISAVLKEMGFGEIEITGGGRIPYLWKSMVVRAKKLA
jgi:2-polyprenyl-3-methyl-5-hydroxy-6-metoxy-1,4-benzoquinol methylase